MVLTHLLTRSKVFTMEALGAREGLAASGCFACQQTSNSLTQARWFRCVGAEEGTGGEM